MSLNTGYVARWDPEASLRYCEKMIDELARGQNSSDDLYVVADDWLERFSQGVQAPQCVIVDGLRACVFSAKTMQRQ